MSDRTDVFRSRHDGVVIPRIWVTVALSICIHIAALWVAPPKLTPPSAVGDDPSSRVQLTLRLNPPGPMVPPAAPMLPSPKQSIPAPQPRAAPRPQPAPPVIATKKPSPDSPQQTPAPVAPPAPAKAAPEGDLSSYIEARRRARGDAAPATPSDDADARSKSVVAGNLGSPRDRSFGYDPRQGGGMFRIERIGTDYAEFHFFGWNNQISRNTKQLIEVRKGENSDIRIAVVRKMIAIIRETAQEDFVWVSTRLGRSLTLSARAKDNGGLEEFMMREFFPDAAPVQK
jgi:hypothetical protein